MNDYEMLIHASYNIRKQILNLANMCGMNSHIGGSMSMVELLVVLYRKILKFKPDDPLWDDRDYFILSKGHCVLAYYTVLEQCGLIPTEMLKSFQKDGSLLSAHPVMNMRIGIESSNGSLGQGISMAVGLAKALKIIGKCNHVYTLIGNGESNEGSVWEAAMSAVQWNLDNLTIILDNNGLQSDGDSINIMQSVSLDEKWRSFGFDVITIDGNDVQEVFDAYNTPISIDKPRIIIGNTIKGCGVSFMENNNDWHHNRLTDKVYNEAMDELEKKYAGI